jgi:hypothetical protein
MSAPGFDFSIFESNVERETGARFGFWDCQKIASGLPDFWVALIK